ncbi:hypothetical protein PISL3812_02418 [Talaromyces islandicus]|uniref:Lanthionine synthetase C family protein n=1 Tax=Talaromyces islandicus TaxID=28573 RepID=A0A0U1LS73_TALIS|nr:hypothetical protein PISL3812_02418 [Talaromyces islandicus]
MATVRPQFYPNPLQPSEINKTSLENTLSELQLAIRNGADAIRKNSQRPTDPSQHGNMYSGISGTVFAFLRLERQKPSILGHEDAAESELGKIALDLLIPSSPDIALSDGRNSPIASGLAPPFARILAACEDQNLQLGGGLAVSEKDVEIIQRAMEGATKHGNTIPFRGHNLGADELLFGRTGLLWTALTLQRHCVEEQAKTTIRPLLEPIFRNVPKLVDTILAAGKQGSQDFEKQHGRKPPLPLMWPWLDDHYALGSVHGISGIISTLLSCDESLLSAQKEDNYLDLMADTVNGLCQICIENDGHLPMTIPPMPSSEERSSPLLQLCHGSPGMLLLLAAAYRNPFFLSKYWRPEWETALHLATEQTWKEGLLSKGGNLCHGLTGNIWPLLPFHDIYDNNSIFQTEVRQQRLAELGKTDTPTTEPRTLSSDYFLSRIIPFMMLARESPPYSEIAGLKPSFDFRAPDRPYCLGEGLVGELCAWAETCVVIKSRLRKMQLEEGGASGCVDHDEELVRYSSQQLGLPLFEVNGPAIYV